MILNTKIIRQWTLEDGKHGMGGTDFDKQAAGVPGCHVFVWLMKGD